MKKFGSRVALLAALAFAAVASAAPSAIRYSGETFEEALHRYGSARPFEENSAVNVAGPVADVDWSDAPELSTDAQLVFRSIRDKRFLLEPDAPLFPRRISWLYPPDGCFARAAAVVGLADEMRVERPAQLFAFGNLTVKTPNVASGSVSWWYHVTPVYRDRTDNRVYAFDPSIEPTHPIPVEDWLLRMVKSLANVKVALCTASAVEPSANCAAGATGFPDEYLALLRDDFLPAEWQNLESMGRKPQLELGDRPPWLQ